ncbi:hypothetical protein Tco_1090996 [Tanacetum coccineum]|uniref:Uncharacterized protein n=1 Tax=Tanacetum coccineum TaxID=301880 RepID=A0ABQ5I5S7_9ASTR
MQDFTLNHIEKKHKCHITDCHAGNPFAHQNDLRAKNEDPMIGIHQGGSEDKILVPKPPQNCATCGDPVDGLYCRPCAFVRKCLNEGWYTIHDKNKILNTSELSNHNTNVVSSPQEPFVFNQDPDSCGNDAHIGYNCPPKAPIIFNPEQCTQTIDELPQTLPSVHPTCNSGDENSFTYDSKPNSVDDSPNVFNPPPQPSMYSCKFCGNDARYGHYCTPQVPFIYPEPCYNQDFNFQQDFHDFQQRYLCCENCGGPHETFQCQPMNEDYYELNSCYDPNSFGFDQFQSLRKKKGELRKIKRLKIDIGRFSFAMMMTRTIPLQSHLVENLVQIPSEFKGISEYTCDVPVCKDPSTFDALSNHSEILSNSNNDGTSSDDDSYENIEYIEASPLNLEIDSLEEVNDVDQEEKDRLVTNIESLKDKPTPDRVLKSPFSFLIPIVDSDSFFEESDTSLSYSDNSLPEFETFSDHTRSGNPLLELPVFESFHFDPSFPRPPPEPPNVEISLIIETNAPVIKNVDELNEDECFDPGGGEINVEVDNSFTIVIWIFLPTLTYPEVSPLLSSTGNEDIIFDPDIST